MRNQPFASLWIQLGAAAALALGLLASPCAWSQATASAYTTGYRYDIASRLVGTIKPDPDGSGPLKFAAVRNTFNAQGMLVRVETGELASWQSEAVLPANWTGFTVFQTLESQHDIWGRKVQESVLAGGSTHSLTQYGYDAAGRLQCTAQRMNPAAYASLPADACALGTEGTHGPDRVTETSYDSHSRVLQVVKGRGSPDQINYATYTYYPLGPQKTVTDANGNLTEYAYDGLARLKRWYFPSPTQTGQSNPADYEEYGYDANGNRTTLRKRDGRMISYDYDKLNRLVAERYPDASARDVHYRYDLRNLQLRARFDSIEGPGLTASYDGFGRLLTATTTQATASRSLGYAYDKEGLRLRVTHPDGKFFAYAYDGLNRLTTVKENDSLQVLNQVYDAQGRRKTLGRTTHLEMNMGTGTSFTPVSASSTSYGYDSVSRLETLTNDLRGTAEDETRVFGYNPASQIVSRTQSNPSYWFNQYVNGSTEYQVNGLNQYTQLSAGATVTPTHDPNGNMTSDGSRSFGYDVLNRLISVGGAQSLNLVYDPKGRLFQTSGGPSGSIQYLYDGDALVAEYDGASGELLRRYVHGVGIDEPLIAYEGPSVSVNARRYLHADHQGSVIALVGGGMNTPTAVNRYDPYGVPDTANTGRFQYTGQIVLPDLVGLYHYKARVYHASLGRFLQTDPVGYKDDFDLYTYVGDDPMNKTDPTGKIAISGEVCLGLCVGVAIGLRTDTMELAATFNAGAGIGGGASLDPRLGENGSAGGGVEGGRSHGVVFNSYVKAGAEGQVPIGTAALGVKGVVGKDFGNGKSIANVDTEVGLSRQGGLTAKAVAAVGVEAGAYVNLKQVAGAVAGAAKAAAKELKQNLVDPAVKAVSPQAPKDEQYLRR